LIGRVNCRRKHGVDLSKRQNVNNQKGKFTVKMQKKLVVLFVGVLLAFAGLTVRLTWIAKEKETQYQKQVLAQQRYDSTTLPFRRGDIVDAKGTKLAVSEKVYNLVIDAKIMQSKEDYLETTLEALRTNFSELDMGAIREYVLGHPNSSWYVPLRQLSYEQIAGFKDAQSQDANIKGVWFEEEYKRIYPNGSLAADVIGFTRSDNQGLYGLEEYYNDLLNGTSGREYGYLNDDLALERTVIPAQDGYTVHSTIDSNIQAIVEKYLKQFNEEHKDQAHEGNGAENVGCVIMEVDTGRILAMASYPTFDLNDTRNTGALIGSTMVEQTTNANGYQVINKTNVRMNEEVLSGMTDEEILLNLNQLWKNYCISETYEPGSTIKPFTVAAALELGDISSNSTYECNGSLEIGGYTIKCHNKYGDGVVDLQQAIARSCNVALMKIGQAMGAEDFSEFQNIFNFGLKTNVDLAGEARTASLIYTADTMGPTDLATNTFGQNFNVTMVQMITGFCSLINGGYYYQPQIVDKITNASGATVENIEPRVLKQTISDSTSQLIRQYCRAVVMPEGGDARTGKTARPAGYAIGGKTGTAETIDPVTHVRSKEDYVVSFMGYAPADDPKIAIYVVVDRVNAAKQDDAKFATGIVRNVLTEVLPYLNIFMTEELSETEKQELEALHLAITTQYTQTPEEEAVENAGEEEQGSGEGGQANQDTGEGQTTQEPAWKSFPIDPNTGYRVDPDTGEQYDADTGYAIADGGASLGDSVPSNPNIVNVQPQE